MQAYQDKSGHIYSEQDYYYNLEALAQDPELLQIINWSSDEVKYQIERDDFVTSVPGMMTLAELDSDLADMGLISDLWGPQDYSISRILSEDWGHNNQRQVLGLKLKHIDGSESKVGGKVIKNVSGYDLSKIYLGSCNSLAVIVGAYLRLERLPSEQMEIVITLQGADSLKQELINYLYRISSNNFDAVVKVLNDTVILTIVIAADTELLELKTRKTLEKLESYFKAQLSDIVLEGDQASYESSDKSLTLSLQRSPYSKHYPSSATRLEFHSPVSNLVHLYQELKEFSERLYSTEDRRDYDLVIYPQASRIDVSLRQEHIEKWLSNCRRLKVRSDLGPYYVNIYPVNFHNKRLEREYNPSVNGDQKIIQKIKTEYDPNHLLNPKILVEELASLKIN